MSNEPGLNHVLATLVAMGVLGAAAPFMELRANRLADGAPLALAQAPSLHVAALGVLALALAGLVLAGRTRAASIAQLVAGVLILLVLCDAAGALAAARLAGAPPAVRCGLGVGFWVMLAAAGLASIDAVQRLRAGVAGVLIALALTAAGFGVLVVFDRLGALSLAREYASRRALFATALLEHLRLTGATVFFAVIIGPLLGVWARRRTMVEAPLFATLGIVQTIPAIALFGLMIGPLAAAAAAFPLLRALGIEGIGPAPAIIALTLYALPPMARNVHAGLASVEPGVIDAARGMGMGAAAIFTRVEVPLAWPRLLTGLRITMVQTIGLAVLAALIGGGGLGAFVFQGIGQYAIDLVLLGALPTLALALAADGAFAALLARSAGTAPEQSAPA